MSKILTRSYAFTVASGATGSTVTFTPQAGKVVGCCIYYGGSLTTLNAGTVSAKLSKTTGDEVVPLTDIRHFRNRDTAFYDGLLPLNLDTENQSFDLTIAATAPFSAAFSGTLVFQYENQNTDYCP